MIIRSIALRHCKPFNGANDVAYMRSMQRQLSIQACGLGAASLKRASMNRVGLNPPLNLNLQNRQTRGISTSTEQISEPISNLSQGTEGELTSSFFASFVPYIEQMPTYFGLSIDSPHAYVISIILATIAMRTTITLPLTIWQRERTKRLTEIVGPKWEQMKRDLPIEVGRRCRAQKKTHEEYKVELMKRLKGELKDLLKKHKCTPLPTLLLPLAANIPLFICASLAIRTALITQGSMIGSEVVPWWSPPADLMAKFEEGAKVLQARGIEGEALQKLTQIQGPTLYERDKTMFGPIGLGMLTFINVELSQWLRKPLIEAPSVQNPKEDETQRDTEKREAREKKASLASLRSSVLSNTLRAASIAFVVVASQAPAGLSIYWLSSATYTLIQNSIFAILDQNRSAAQIKKDQNL